MTITFIAANTRGNADHGWLQSNFSFSFANYYDPKRMHFGALRVLNDDIIAPGKGFGLHPHDNAEIITIVLEGTVEHKDSLNNVGQIKVGEIQHITAGSGIAHSEYNPSKTEKLKLLQLWIEPREYDVKPSYQQSKYQKKKNSFVQIVGKDSMHINQDASLYLGDFSKDTTITQKTKKSHGLYIFVIEGLVKVQEQVAKKRDALEISNMDSITLDVSANSQVLLIDVPMQ